MRALILYRPGTEQEGMAADYARDYHSRHTDKTLDLLSLDTKEGSDFAQLYDIVRYPAILIIADNGSLVQLWQDSPLPLLDEVDAYLIQT